MPLRLLLPALVAAVLALPTAASAADTQKPTAVLDAPSAVATDAKIALSGSRSFDSGGGTVKEWRWTVGSRNTVVRSTNTFDAPAFSVPGRVTVSLVVVDDSGNVSNPISATVIVRDEAAPTAVIQAPVRVAVGAAIPLDGSLSSDTGGGEVVEWRWTVASRPLVARDIATFNAPGFATPQKVTVKLVVVDDAGNESAAVPKDVIVADDIAPTAVIDAPTSVLTGQSIALGGSRSADTGGGHVIEWRWTVGSRPAVARNTDSFNAPGFATPQAVTVTLVVVDDAGNVSAPTTARVVVREDRVPTAVLDVPSAVSTGQAIALDGTRSFDTGGGVVREWRWTVGDRPTVATDSATFQAAAFDAPGRMTVRLVVRDDSGNESAPVSADVIVRDDTAPTAIIDAPLTSFAGRAVAVSGARSFDGGGGQVRELRWSVDGGPLVVRPDSSVTTPELGAGRHTVSLVVVDDAGNESAPVSAAIDVAAVPRDEAAPVAVLDAPASVVGGATVVLGGSRSTDSGGGRIVRYRWTITGRRPVVTQASTFNVTGLARGTYQVTLVVTDDAGNDSTAATRTVVVTAPKPPVGTKVSTFGLVTLLAPVGKKTSQIDGATLIAGRIYSPAAATVAASFKFGRLKLGPTKISVGADKAARLRLKLSKKARAAFKGRRTAKVTMTTTVVEKSTGLSVTRSRLVVFRVN